MTICGCGPSRRSAGDTNTKRQVFSPFPAQKAVQKGTKPSSKPSRGLIHCPTGAESRGVANWGCFDLDSPRFRYKMRYKKGAKSGKNGSKSGTERYKKWCLSQSYRVRAGGSGDLATRSKEGGNGGGEAMETRREGEVVGVGGRGQREGARARGTR